MMADQSVDILIGKFRFHAEFETSSQGSIVNRGFILGVHRLHKRNQEIIVVAESCGLFLEFLEGESGVAGGEQGRAFAHIIPSEFVSA